jgi:hypothetical protein
LAVAGTELLGKKGVRLFWLQAKGSATKSLSINYWQDTVAGGLRQFNALLKTNAPERGSFGIYVKYIGGLAYPLSFPASDVPLPYGSDEPSCTLKLEALAFRFQEHLADAMTNPVNGTFQGGKEAGKFVAELAERPKEIVTIRLQGDALAKDLLRDFKRAVPFIAKGVDLCPH